MSEKIWQLMDFLGMLWDEIRSNLYFGILGMAISLDIFVLAAAMVWMRFN